MVGLEASRWAGPTESSSAWYGNDKPHGASKPRKPVQPPRPIAQKADNENWQNSRRKRQDNGRHPRWSKADKDRHFPHHPTAKTPDRADQIAEFRLAAACTEKRPEHAPNLEQLQTFADVKNNTSILTVEIKGSPKNAHTTNEFPARVSASKQSNEPLTSHKTHPH